MRSHTDSACKNNCFSLLGYMITVTIVELVFQSWDVQINLYLPVSRPGPPTRVYWCSFLLISALSTNNLIIWLRGFIKTMFRPYFCYQGSLKDLCGLSLLRNMQYGKIMMTHTFQAYQECKGQTRLGCPLTFFFFPPKSELLWALPLLDPKHVSIPDLSLFLGLFLIIDDTYTHRLFSQHF